MSKIDEIKQAFERSKRSHRHKSHFLESAPEYIPYLLEENERLRKGLEEKENHIKEIMTEKAILEGELSQANAYKHFEAERTKEAVQLHKELEEIRKDYIGRERLMHYLKELYKEKRENYYRPTDLRTTHFAEAQLRLINEIQTHFKEIPDFDLDKFMR